jgi:mannose-6-phosphate isomerase-like protein (cupin superfamily)
VKPEYLSDLTELALVMLRRGGVSETLNRLKRELRASPEPFVWASVGLRGADELLPPEIRSAWLFALKAGMWSGLHHHPNSVQHMIVVSGRGRSKIAGVEGGLTAFDRNAGWEEQWCVIDRGVPHEFFPEGEDMVVMSFHTAGPDELLEVSADSNSTRRYSAPQ